MQSYPGISSTFEHKMTAKVNLVMALLCEARPLIDHLNLRKVTQISAWSVFSNEEQNLQIIISGVGKVNAAAATAFLHAVTNSGAQTYYLNLGIAGSGEHALGECLIANKIVDQGSGQVWYPSMLSKQLPQSSIMTVERAPEQYKDLSLIDMEAAGFFPVACRFVSQELVQVIKVVSDNAAQPCHHITAAKVIALMEQQLSAILKVIDGCLQFSLQEMQSTMPVESTELATFLQKWHFSVYQQYQLQELLRRWSVIKRDNDALTAVQPQNNAAQVLASLTRQLDEAAYQW